MREKVVEATVRALQRAETSLPDWVLQRIEEAAARESHPLARHHLQFMLENVAIAGAKGPAPLPGHGPCSLSCADGPRADFGLRPF